MLALPERKLRAWRQFDRQEPIGVREPRLQRAELLAMVAAYLRPKGAQALDRADFLLQTVGDLQQRKLDKMVSMLTAMATTKPAGYKRKSPKRRK